MFLENEEEKKRRSESTIAFLKILSWIGISAGASHWMGTLTGNKDRYKVKPIEIERTLTTSSAKYENKLLGREYLDPPCYRKGNKVKGWLDRDKLIKEAVKLYKSYYPNAKILLCGDSMHNPSRVLDCVSQKDMDGMNIVHKNFEKGYNEYGSWIDDDYMEICYSAWKLLVKKYKV